MIRSSPRVWILRRLEFKIWVSRISSGLRWSIAERNPVRAASYVMISLKAKSILGFIKKLSIVLGVLFLWVLGYFLYRFPKSAKECKGC